MGSLERLIRRIHSPPWVGGSTRSRNTVLRWKDHASSPVPAVANTPRRQRDCAAPCCSPPQTSFCERASHGSLSSGAFANSGAIASWFISGSNAVLHASPSSAFFPPRQIVISCASIEADSRRRHHGDRNTRVPEPALGAKHRPLEVSTPLQSFRVPQWGR